MQIIPNASLRDYSYYRTGGRCTLLFLPENPFDVCVAIKEINSLKLKYYILGAGSNSLVSDDFYEGAVVCLRNMQKLSVQNHNYITAEAGVENSSFVEYCLEKCLGPTAWMYGLPGHLGGTIRMNARCYGGEISEIVDTVDYVDERGELHSVKADNKIFRGYKDTVFMEKSWIIVAARMKLQLVDQEEMRLEMQRCKNDRQSKGQYLFPSCGCVFKNDYSVGVPSGMLLDASGIKAFKSRGIEVNPHHANFVFNTGAATSEDIINFSLKMRKEVFQKFGVWLDYEMEILGSIKEDLKKRITEHRETPKSIQNNEALNELKQKFHLSQQPRRKEKV